MLSCGAVACRRQGIGTRIVPYNIQYSRGEDERYDLRCIVDTVVDADIIALQEVDRFWPRTGMTDQAAEVAAMLPEHF